MKYAILGSRGNISSVTDEEPTDARYFVEITNEQAQSISNSEERLFIIDGELQTRQKLLSEKRWDIETEKWELLPPPTELTPRQFRLALLQNNIKESDVLNLIDQIEDEAEKEVAKINWNFASKVVRNNELIQAMAEALEWTEENLDDLFRLGKTFK